MADCPICRDLQPVDCPGCARPLCRLCGLEDGACICAHIPVTNDNKQTWIDKLNASVPRMDADTCLLHAMAGKMTVDVEYEIFRSIGEPWHGVTPEYPDKYGYYPGCNEG